MRDIVKLLLELQLLCCQALKLRYEPILCQKHEQTFYIDSD
jgi:hypothetical protein